MRFTASHGFTRVDTWPVDTRRGRPLDRRQPHYGSRVRSSATAAARRSWASTTRATAAGVVHYSPPEDPPAKKIWSWGRDPDGLDWRKALSDDESAYVEVQAGLFRNQETYAFLEPQETIALQRVLAAAS